MKFGKIEKIDQASIRGTSDNRERHVQSRMSQQFVEYIGEFSGERVFMKHAGGGTTGFRRLRLLLITGAIAMRIGGILYLEKRRNLDRGTGEPTR